MTTATRAFYLWGIKYLAICSSCRSEMGRVIFAPLHEISHDQFYWRWRAVKIRLKTLWVRHEINHHGKVT